MDNPAGKEDKDASKATVAPYDLRNMLTVPRFIRVIFDRFPLRTYPAEPSSWASPRTSNTATLFVYDRPDDISDRSPSRYPSCLKWQTALKMCKVEFNMESSNDHAAPEGSLPYLLPTLSPDVASLPKPIASSDLLKWIILGNSKNKSILASRSDKAAIFRTLLDTKIRDAWLHCFFIAPGNFTTLTRPRLTHATPTWPVDRLIGHGLQKIAYEELRRSRPGGVVCAADIYAEADTAFRALSQVLGSDNWFFGGKEAGLFDAEVFAYTETILSADLHPTESALKDCLWAYENLIGHRDLLKEQVYGSG